MSVNHDVKSKIGLVSTILPQNVTADVNGAGVDTQDSHGVGFMAHIGASGDTLSGSVKIEMEVQHSDDNSNWTAALNTEVTPVAAGATNTGCFAVIDANAEASQIYKANYLGLKRYVRVVANLTGTHTNGTPMSAIVMVLPTKLPA